MKLSDIRGENAIDVIADIIDPLTIILADKEIQEVRNKPTLLIAKAVLKTHKKEILEILAILNETDPKEFNPSLIELPIMLVQLINDVQNNEELASLFTSHGQMKSSVSFGGAMETTQETEEI